MVKEFKNYVIESDLYYLLLAYNDAKDFLPTKGQKISMLTKEEVLKLTDEAISYYKNSIKTLEEYLEELPDSNCE